MTTSTDHSLPLLNSVLDCVGSDIVSGAIVPGSTFTLQSLSERFNVSRTVAREAMRALEQLGLVSSSRRVGITVLPMQEWSVFDHAIISWRLSNEKTREEQVTSLNQLRLSIEPMAARLAATSAPVEERREILALARKLHELENTPSPRTGEELAADLRFHTMVLHASGNEMFAALAPSLLSLLKGKSVFGSAKRNPLGGTAELHLDLARAICDSRPDEAEALARAILDTARTSIN
ncbi:FadR/GntR family transcriptional regulator [Corynebacterium flavescens]|uniref:FadR/GntR family transcriptional regulator n=1 Tax=Corynebacterium flavescens TaxID=28028 RepID=UPI003F937374